MKKRKTGLAIMLLLLVVAVVIMTSGIANATPTATRKLPAEVPADRSFSVEIKVSDPGTTVVETLPDGFTYTTSTLNSRDVKACGQTTIEFTLYKKNVSLTTWT